MRKASSVVLALVLLVGLASCAPDEGDEKFRRVPADPAAPAVGLRVRLDDLFREHLFLLVLQTENALTRQPSPLRGASEAFDQHAIAFAEQFNTYYGSKARDAFLKVWRGYQSAAVGFAARSSVPPRNQRQRNQLERTQTALSGVSVQLGAFAGTLTPLLSSRGVAMRMQDVLGRLRNAIGFQIKKDYVKANAELLAGSDLCDELASAFTTGIAMDIPITLTGNSASFSGTYRTLLTANLREHVWLLALVVENALTGQSVPQQGAQSALDANTGAFPARLGQIYGEEFSKALAPLWKRHVDLLLTYGTAGKDQVKRDKAAADLKQHASDFGAFLTGANDQIGAGAVGEFMTAHVENLRALFDAQAKADFTAAGTAMRKAADHMDSLAALLASATVAKFPAKFL